MEVDSTLLGRPDIYDDRLFITVVVETYPPEINGVSLTAKRLVESLIARGHSVQLIRPRQSRSETPCRSEHFSEELVLGIPIPRYNALRFGLPAKRLLKKQWAQRRPDLVHIMTEGPLGWSALNTARHAGIPTTSSFHTNFHRYSEHYGIGWLSKCIGNYLRAFHNRSAATMIASLSLAHELESDGYKNLHLVGRGVNTSMFSPLKRSESLRVHWKVASNEIVALYVGRLAPEKNLALAVKTYEAMRQITPMRMVFVGDGPLRRELEKRHPECIFPGTQLGEDLAAHYASADIFIFPSLSETFGNVTIEAMASGLAVIAFDYAAAKEYIDHKKNGLVAKFAHDDQFIQMGKSLASTTNFIPQLGAAARETAKTISWDAVFDQFERIVVDTVRKARA